MMMPRRLKWAVSSLATRATDILLRIWMHSVTGSNRSSPHGGSNASDGDGKVKMLHRRGSLVEIGRLHIFMPHAKGSEIHCSENRPARKDKIEG